MFKFVCKKHKKLLILKVGILPTQLEHIKSCHLQNLAFGGKEKTFKVCVLNLLDILESNLL